MTFRNYGILLILGLMLAFIAWQARTGFFRRHSPNDQPANKYMRQILESPQISEADAEVLREKYGTAHANPSGLRYLLRRPGEGSPPGVGAQVAVHFEGYLLDGTKFDSSLGSKPHTFRAGTGAVIKGWDEAIMTMKKGEKRTLLIPWWLAFGEKGRGPVPPRSVVRFEVELVDIQ